MSREQLASDLGVHYNTLGLWLRGSSDCPVGWVPLIAKILDVPAQDLVQDRSVSTQTSQRPDKELAQKVVETLEGPLSAPDLMDLLAEAQRRLQ